MRRIICTILLTALLLCLCACASEPEWKPYTGNLEGYVYYYENERERAWEEDVLSLANTFLTEHPLLLDKESTLRYLDVNGFRSTHENLYNETLHTDFLKAINDLIPRLSELTDDQIPYELQKIIAVLGDFHSQVLLSATYYFPFTIEPFYEGGEVELRIIGLPKEYKEFVYAKLISINGVGIDEVISRLAPYGSVENEYSLIARLTDVNLGGMLCHSGILTAAGIMESETETTDFVLMTEDGKQHTVSIAPIPSDQLQSIDRENRSVYTTYSYTFRDWRTDLYWYELWPEENTAYVRINRFYEEKDETLERMCERLASELIKHEQVDKIILDLRRNYGGHSMEQDFQRLMRILRMKQIKNVCVLIDHCSTSRAVSVAYQIKRDVENVTLIGSPTGEGSFHIGTEDDNRALPNSGTAYIIGTIALELNREQPFDALLPDIAVYPVLEDYKNGVDTILEAAKNK